MTINIKTSSVNPQGVGGVVLPGECPFCEYEPTSEIIWESENFFLVPSLGQISEGYVLLCTKMHYLGMADIKREQLQELEESLAKIQKSLQKIYGPTIVWEHGSAGCAKSVGGCLNHAHFNIFPISTKKMIDKVSPEFKVVKINGFEELAKIKGSYIFLKDSDGAMYVLTNDGVTPSQYFRQLIAKELGKEDRWDWRVYVGEEEFKNTIKKLRPILADTD